MNNPILLSIVIPVYNVELYIERCLLSCLNQDLSISQYEIILIDDGSPDSSIDKISKWLDRKNITLLTQPNSGLSVARNNGLLHAKGKYVWFVDSNDWILENCLQEIAGYMVAGIDIITFCAADFINDKFYRRFEYITGVNKKIEGRDLLKRGTCQHCVPFSIYRKRFLEQNHLFFLPNIFHEDTEFSPRAYYLANHVFCINKVFYYVYHNPNSITRTFNPKKSFDLLIVSHSLSIFMLDVTPEYKSCFNNLISLSINAAINGIVTAKSEISRFIVDLTARGLYRNMLNAGRLRYKIEGLLLYLCPALLICLYKHYSSLRRIIK